MMFIRKTAFILSILVLSPLVLAENCDPQHELCLEINRLNVADDVLLYGDVSFNGTIWDNYDIAVTNHHEKLNQGWNINLPASLFNWMFKPTNVSIKLNSVNNHKVYNCQLNLQGDLQPGKYTITLKRYWLFGDHYSCRINQD